MGNDRGEAENYFGTYGDVVETIVMRDKVTGKPRGFGFVDFADPSIVERVLQESHSIDGRTVDAKKAMPREEQRIAVRSGSNDIARNAAGGSGGGNHRTKKIFVGGLPPTLSEIEFRKYFEAFGTVTDVVVMYDQNTQRPRGFGFISFDSEDSAEHACQQKFHDLGGKAVEVKRALPKDANPILTTNRSTGTGGYQSYGGSGANTNSYDNRMDVNKYMQPQAPYGSSAYGAPPYGYGATTNGVGFSGYGSYGNTGSYGNPSGGPVAGFVSGPPGAPRTPWSNQAPSGYGSAGYGSNAAYGGAGPWSSPVTGGGQVPGHGAHSQGAQAGYGNQGYGFVGYNGTEAPYGNQSGYGVSGGRVGGSLPGNAVGSAGEQRSTPGILGGGYNDSGSTGYSNAWASGPAQGGGYVAGHATVPWWANWVWWWIWWFSTQTHTTAVTFMALCVVGKC
ncbi:hypothetical protein HPP92_022506 [Vanilla planifolia]|uniref:RRM domain-containing protein n=1 Tax=Vanilla planifolia TaxID=51239 RepID=A0A835PTH1_VANPL|nr:hypothetical protein HPP92_022506 [Vanilla planifolia]